MKRNYYLIDTENVGDRWINYIDHLGEEEILVVFYTKNHSKLLEETYLKQRYNQQIRWVECMTGSNALDYQLIGVLSYLIATHAEASYSIFSNDSDYQDIIDFWEQRNVYIGRVGFSMDKKKGKKSSAKDSLPNKPPQLSDEIADKKDMDVLDITEVNEEDKLTEIAKAIPISNMAGWYAALTALMGQEKGRDYYIQLKDNPDQKSKLSQHLLPDTHRRKVHLIKLFYQQHHLDTTKAETAYRIVCAHKPKNKSAIKADFDKNFGKKTSEQAQYYKVIKPFIPLLKAK